MAFQLINNAKQFRCNLITKNIMSIRSFKAVIIKYEMLSRLGREIIQHKEKIKHVKPSMLDVEFAKQEKRIEIFHERSRTVQQLLEKK